MSMLNDLRYWLIKIIKLWRLQGKADSSMNAMYTMQ